jgi:Tol biopolymer transport system component
MKRTIRVLMAIALCAGIATTGSPAIGGATAINGRIGFNRHDLETDATSTFTIDTDGSNEAQVGAGDVGLCEDWSPDATKFLTCIWLENEGARPATANPDGSDFTVLDAYPNLQQSLACGDWTPDATRFLCHSEENANPADNGFYTVRSSDGGDLQQIVATPAGFVDFPFGYSPDGSRILFNRIDQSTEQGFLFSVGADGSGLLRLSPSTLSVFDPEFFDSVSADWSPNGTQVTFAGVWKPAFRGRQFALYVVNADGTDLRQITPAGVGAVSAQWSPDGHVITFSTKRVRGTPPPQVWVVHPDGTGLQELTSGTSISIAPIWSPDGAKLLFQRWQKNGVDSLWTMQSDGTGSSKLTDTGSPSSYSWGTAPAE